MFEIQFSLKNCENESRAHMAFMCATRMLDLHQIPYTQSVDDILYDGDDFRIRSPRTFYTVYKILFESRDDYITYMLIRD